MIYYEKVHKPITTNNSMLLVKLTVLLLLIDTVHPDEKNRTSREEIQGQSQSQVTKCRY